MYSKMRTCPFIKAFLHEDSTLDGSYPDRLEALRHALGQADHVVIGAGAGLSAAAGLEYGGRRFADNFADFIRKYRVTDMYAATFYPFSTEEERWAYLARHVRLNRYDNEPAAGLYQSLSRIVSGKNYFVITTNVDGLFEKAGFDTDRIFAVQGDYAYLQCAVGCHERLYYNEQLVREMCRHTENCRIPSSLVPHCPVCGGRMELHIRKDGYFIQDSQWHECYARYGSFLQEASHGNTLLLEFGVGYNTPTIIRFPFEQMASQADNITLVRINRDYPNRQTSAGRFLPFGEDMNKVLADLHDCQSQTSRLSKSNFEEVNV